MNDKCEAAVVSRCNVETLVDGGCSSFRRYCRPRTTPQCVVAGRIALTRFPASGSLHLRGSWRRLGLLVHLCLLCAVWRSSRFRGGVRRARGAEKASGDSGSVSGQYFGASVLKVGDGQRQVVEVEGLVGWLEVRRCLAAAAAVDGVHVLDCQVDTRLKALQTFCGEIACLCDFEDVADSVLESLQLQLMWRATVARLQHRW